MTSPNTLRIALCPLRALSFLQPTSIRDRFGSCSLVPVPLWDRSITTYRPSFDGRQLAHFYPLPFLFPCEIQVCFKFHYFFGSNKTSAPIYAKETQGAWTMHMQIIEEAILRERELFQESLAECHYLTSGKTIQHRSGFLGLASVAILLIKKQKKNLIHFIWSAHIWRSCYLLEVPWFSECRSSSCVQGGISSETVRQSPGTWPKAGSLATKMAGMLPTGFALPPEGFYKGLPRWR